MAAPALPREAATQRYRTRSRAAGIGRILVLTLGSTLLLAYLLGPIVWLVSSSVQTEAEIVSVPPHWIPDQPTLQTSRRSSSRATRRSPTRPAPRATR